MTLALPAGFSARAARPQDLDAVVDVFAAYDEAVVGHVEPRREFLEETWALPFVAMPHDTRSVEHEGTAAAYAHAVWDPSEGRHQFGLGRVIPGLRGRGIGTALLAWMEGGAVLRGQHGGARIIPRTSIVSLDEPAAALLCARGYRLVRSGVDMGMALRGDELAIPPPEGIRFDGFITGRDEHTAFARDPGPVVVARRDDKPVGFVASIIVSGGGYITSLGVREP